MNIAPAGMIGGLPLASPLSGVTPPSNGAVFGNVVEQFVADTNAQQLQADASVQQLATGQSESVHETMLTLAKADLSLRVFVEVRNKVIDAYQEVMRMPM
ncbi:MAG: flagellar hook-basal body complex subunit FliE [Schlesneria sp.]|nr:flagellar hook-basal body complex subunit FliE [Schlesneria sp.]